MKPASNLKLASMNAVRPALTRQPTVEKRRSSQRVLLRMPVTVHVAGKQAAISGFTQAVSANGAVVILPEGLAAGSKMILENPSTKHRVEAHVVRPPQFSPEGSLVPIEFLSPASQFWNVVFPP